VNSLLITDTFLPRIGGRENYYHHLFSRFESKLVIVTPDKTGNYQQFDQEYVLPVVRAGDLSQKWFVWGRPGRIQWLRTLVKICWDDQIDVTHCGLVLPDGLSGWLLQKTLGKPYIIYTHGKEILEHQNHPRWGKYMQVALASASRVVCNSHYTGEILKQVGVAPEKIVRICPGVDAKQWTADIESDRMAAMRQQYALSDQPIILSVGRLIERKGHDKVIESLPLVLSQFPDAVYLIVGDGPERSRLENLRDRLGLQNSVRFTGAVSDTDLLAFYKLATLFAMISRQPPNSHEVEGFGIVYLEANVSGLPVVAGRSGGVPDAVVEGETGYLVDPFSPEAIASAIIRLLENPQLCAQLAHYGRERAIKEFSWEQASDRLQKLTAEVCLETPKRSLLSTAIHTLPLIWQRSLFD